MYSLSARAASTRRGGCYCCLSSSEIATSSLTIPVEGVVDVGGHGDRGWRHHDLDDPGDPPAGTKNNPEPLLDLPIFVVSGG